MILYMSWPLIVRSQPSRSVSFGIYMRLQVRLMLNLSSLAKASWLKTQQLGIGIRLQLFVFLLESQTVCAYGNLRIIDFQMLAKSLLSECLAKNKWLEFYCLPWMITLFHHDPNLFVTKASYSSQKVRLKAMERVSKSSCTFYFSLKPQ